MAKRTNKKGSPSKVSGKAQETKENKTVSDRKEPLSTNPSLNDGYLWSMSYAPAIDKSLHWFQLVPAILFSAIVIMITRMASYTRPMEQFYWTNAGNDLTDFFSYYKMILAIVCAVLALVFLAYRLCTQSLAIKRSALYIPMAVYALCVILSYAFSDYKEFSLLGWNDRFEGTLVLLAYIIMLFYIINSVNTATAVKFILYPIGVVSAILGLLGVTQALDHDFFRTSLGQKLIVPNTLTDSGTTTWEMIDEATKAGQQFLSFTFQNKEIYQTVYNINYVSFYLTLLLPIVGLLFIKTVVDHSNAKKAPKEDSVQTPIGKIILLGALFALLIYNLIGSASSGGFLGMFGVIVFAIIIANKRITHWIKPLIMLVVITLVIGGITFDRWSGEIQGAIKAATVKGTPASEEPADTAETPDAHGKIDYMTTEGNDITVSYLGEELIISTVPEQPASILVRDGDGKNIELIPTEDHSVSRIDDERFDSFTVSPAIDEEKNSYIILNTAGDDWPFIVSDDGVKYVNGFGHQVSLHQVPAGFFKDNPSFGTGRGYIWSRTFPMMADTVILGHGADTYCIYFPHDDYVGKYNSINYSSKINIIVDKPHNMYMGMWVGTGGISVIAFLAIALMYAVQTIKVYRGRRYESFLDFVGLGIFLGVMGFLITGLVDDSSVSVMPMFYALLGTGVAVNMILQRSEQK